MKSIAVAIDGPSGAGKSTIARAVAERLGFVYVDTGAMYRTIGLAVCRAGVQLGDTAGILPVLPGIGVSLNYQDGVQHVLLNGEDVSGLIRTPEMSKYASFVSAVPEVRAFLLDTQRDMAKKCSVIMDGRDIGTVILPDAEVKIFLTASPEARARRRWLELQQKGENVTLDEVLADMIQRDRDDTTRAEAPLRQAEDAVLVDTSELTLEQSMDAVEAVIRRVLEGQG
ncbi:(d)CMP kinase [Butyricicoccus sp.]|uniref:(d)CMP kinase n=1 Tax=Butyricicoccus sp. TaxID=2049021 RepID=UPI00373562D3